ncbi:MAG TPA: methionyl-tRNA formyltransferase [Steroidobacteraceae bacterium]|nr:methionyl-tRNA formyltransferase [Steroidobacteraceae bacterium]
MLRVAFAGTPAFALPALEALAGSGHQLVGVLTQPDRPAGRGRHSSASPVKQRAAALGVPIDQPAQLRLPEQCQALRRWAPDVLVVVAYGLLLPRAVLELPRLGGVNIHASLLPRWRGAAPIQRAILAGDSNTGISIMQMQQELDAGAVLAQSTVPIGAHTTTATLEEELAQLGAALLLASLAELEAGTARPQIQDPAGVSYASKISREEARIDWQADATQIARQVRAFNPRPIAYTEMAGQSLRIWQAQALADEAAPAPAGTILGLGVAGLNVACGRGALAIAALQLAGKRVVSAADFAHAHQLAGLHFG